MTNIVFQSTLPHGERPLESKDYFVREMISIHAPARGATCGAHYMGYPRSISIHAPARGATILREAAEQLCRDFNPRSRTGSDPFALRPCPIGSHISIHAPARGATYVIQGIEEALRISIHAPARGATDIEHIDHTAVEFQSTLPHGERLVPGLWAVDCQGISIHAPARGATALPPSASFPRCHFNPRSRTGSDVWRLQM